MQYVVSNLEMQCFWPTVRPCTLTDILSQLSCEKLMPNFIFPQVAAGARDSELVDNLYIAHYGNATVPSPLLHASWWLTGQTIHLCEPD